MVASWLSGLWRLQSDTLGSGPAVAGFSLFSFLLEQIEFHLNLHVCSVMFYDVSLYSVSSHHIVQRLSITVHLKYDIQFASTSTQTPPTTHHWIGTGSGRYQHKSLQNLQNC